MEIRRSNSLSYYMTSITLHSKISQACANPCQPKVPTIWEETYFQISGLLYMNYQFLNLETENWLVHNITAKDYKQRDEFFKHQHKIYLL